MPIFFKDKINSWTILEIEPVLKPKKPRGFNRHWWCKCECGKIKLVNESNLKTNKSTSCGTCKRLGENNSGWKGYKQISGHYWINLKKAAERRNIPFQVNMEEAWEVFEKQNGKCAYSGIELQHSRSKKKNNNVASIDRIDSSKPYTKDNIQWVNAIINTMKWNHSEEEFLNLIKMIAKYKGL
jgi:hypothetical protein